MLLGLTRQEEAGSCGFLREEGRGGGRREHYVYHHFRGRKEMPTWEKFGHTGEDSNS